MKIKYFSDFNGNTTELFSCRPMSNSDFAKQFPGITGKRRDSFTRMIGVLNGQIFPITRVVFYKRNPSPHECSSKCHRMGNAVALANASAAEKITVLPTLLNSPKPTNQ